MADISIYLKAIIESDICPIVVCDTKHNIVYMNKASIDRYHNNLVGKSIFDCHGNSSRELIERVTEWFKKDYENNRIYTFRNNDENKDVYMIALRDDSGELIGYYEKHEYRSIETSPLYNFR